MAVIFPRSMMNEMILGVHRPVANASDPAITADPYRLALYAASQSLDATTTAYATAGEVSGTGYTAGGFLLTPSIETVTVSSKQGYGLTFANITISGNPASFTFRRGLVYRDTGTIKRAYLVLEWDADQVVNGNSYLLAPQSANNMLPIMLTPA